MKNYARPVIEVADQLAEGVYMSLSGESQPVALNDALGAATGEQEIEADTNAADLTTGVGGSNGDTEAGGDTQNDAAGTPQDITPDTAGDSDAIEMADASAAADTPAESGSESPESTETSSDGGVTEESLGMQSSILIDCDSKYMNGVWQGTRQGSWGGMQLGCKEVLGCKDCPADKGNGCGLQDSNAASLYFRKIGTLMPGWEASGKMPMDSPYGI